MWRLGRARGSGRGLGMIEKKSGWGPGEAPIAGFYRRGARGLPSPAAATGTSDIVAVAYHEDVCDGAPCVVVSAAPVASSTQLTKVF